MTKHRFFTLSAALLGAALLLATPSPASAKDHGKHGHGNGRGKGHAARVDQHYRVPRVITVDHRNSYRPYFTGRKYYAPHGHYHAAYRFPVYVNGVVVQRPYAYCNDHLFVTGSVALPQLAFNFSYGSPGVAVGGYYAPAPPSYYVYEPRYRRDDHRGHDCDHDRWDD